MISFTGSALFASYATALPMERKLTLSRLPPLYSITCFTLLSAGNLFCSYKALNALQFKTLDVQRYFILVDNFLGNGCKILSPHEVQQQEAFVKYSKVPRIELNASVSQLVELQLDQLSVLLKEFSSQQYIVHLSQKTSQVFLMFKTGAADEDILEGYFLAYLLLSTHGQNRSKEGLHNFFNKNFPIFYDMIRQSDWDLSNLCLDKGEVLLECNNVGATNYTAKHTVEKNSLLRSRSFSVRTSSSRINRKIY